MDEVVRGFLERNLPEFADCFAVNITEAEDGCDCFKIFAKDGRVNVSANNYISAFHGIYEYLKKYCRVQLSWCGNRNLKVTSLKPTDGVFEKQIFQKYRVYMNYCTLSYSMCW